MITNSAGTQAISNLGWIDRGGVYVYQAPEFLPCFVKLSEARFLKLYPGSNDFFAVQHGYSADRVAITAHHHSEAATEISQIAITARPGVSRHAPTPDRLQVKLDGAADVWVHLPKAYVVNAFGDAHLVLLDARSRSVEVQHMDWYDDKTYDKGYQGLASLAEVPGTQLLMISVQRDSNLVLYDPGLKTVVRKVSLAGRSGNPSMYFCRYSNELWASDYDTLVRVETESWKVNGSILIQGAVPGTQEFMGDFIFEKHERMCLAARPFSGDVIVLELTSLQKRQSIKLGQQPLTLALMADGEVLARDWKTGSLLRGQLLSGWS